MSIMKWIKYIPVVICVAQVIGSVAQQIEEAKQDDGTVDFEEVLDMVAVNVGSLVECLKKIK